MFVGDYNNYYCCDPFFVYVLRFESMQLGEGVVGVVVSGEGVVVGVVAVVVGVVGVGVLEGVAVVADAVDGEVVEGELGVERP